MHKKMLSLVVTILLPTFIIGMDSADTQSNRLETEKAKISQQIKKDDAELAEMKKNKVLAPAIAKVEPIVSKVLSSPEFKSALENSTTQQAQAINQGKTFEEVKYNHSLTSEFPKLKNPNKLLVSVY